MQAMGRARQGTQPLAAPGPAARADSPMVVLFEPGLPQAAARPNTAPTPSCLHGGKPGSHGWCGQTPRRMAVRSRVVLQRTPHGVKAVIPHPALLAVSDLHAEGDREDEYRRVCPKRTEFVGKWDARVPIELVDVPRPFLAETSGEAASRILAVAKRPATCPGGSLSGVLPAKPASPSKRPRDVRGRADDGSTAPDAAPPAAHPALSYGIVEGVELTPELRQELKAALEGMNDSSRVDLKCYPRSLKLVMQHLHDLCELLNAPLLERSYRVMHGSHMLHHFVQLLPRAKDPVDLPPASERLPKKGWFPITVLLTLTDVSWDFQYNAVRHKVCSCKIPDACVSPFCAARPGSSVRGLLASARFAATSQRGAAELSKIVYLRRHERHFPHRLVELASALRVRFLAFVARLPSFVEDFMKIQEAVLPPPRGSTSRLLWERFLVQTLSEVRVLDRAYTLFERLFLEIVDSVIGEAVQPVSSMTEPSSVLTVAPLDAFREVHTAVVCQRLGLLKRRVHFGGPYNLVEFNPDLLVKAKRAVQLSTYPEIALIAEKLIVRFTTLCQVLGGLKIEQLRPELIENQDLRTVVLELDEVWAECQFLLQQDTLDFIGQLLDMLRRSDLSEMTRWRYRLALWPGKSADGVEVTEEDLGLARFALFNTLPILVYFDEVLRDIEHEKIGTKHILAGDLNRFRELFYPEDPRHTVLRRDFFKFDSEKADKFRSFVMAAGSEGWSELTLQTSGLDRSQVKYFGMLYRNLKDVAAFVPADPSEVVLAATSAADDEVCLALALPDDVRERRRRRLINEARARWVAVHKVAQSVEPALFPATKPAETSQQRSQKRPGTSTRQSVAVPAVSVGKALQVPQSPSKALEETPTPHRRSSRARTSTEASEASFDDRRPMATVEPGLPSPRRLPAVAAPIGGV